MGSYGSCDAPLSPPTTTDVAFDDDNDVEGGDLRRRYKTHARMARAIAETPPTAAPTMTPVPKPPCPDEAEESGDEVEGAGEEPDFGRVVWFGEAAVVVPEPDPEPEPVPEPVAGLGLPINAPGPISGVSKHDCGCETGKENMEGKEGSYHQRRTL